VLSRAVSALSVTLPRSRIHRTAQKPGKGSRSINPPDISLLQIPSKNWGDLGTVIRQCRIHMYARNVSKEGSYLIRTEMLIHSKQVGPSSTGPGRNNAHDGPSARPHPSANGQGFPVIRGDDDLPQLANQRQELQLSEQKLADRTHELRQREREVHRVNRWLVIVSTLFLVPVVIVVVLSVLYAKAKNQSPINTTLTVSTQR
jgi:hypothetical protein